MELKTKPSLIVLAIVLITLAIVGLTFFIFKAIYGEFLETDMFLVVMILVFLIYFPVKTIRGRKLIQVSGNTFKIKKTQNRVVLLEKMEDLEYWSSGRIRISGAREQLHVKFKLKNFVCIYENEYSNYEELKDYLKTEFPHLREKTN